MASDLSNLIQDSLTRTLESLLAKTTSLKLITQANPAELKGSCIQVKTLFKFENFSSNWVFLIPTFSANSIFNLMMSDDSEPSDKLNIDTLDALNEVTSNICGSLSTSINGASYTDLGSVQFSLEGNEIIDDISSFLGVKNIYRFKILIEDKEIFIFILFDEYILSYIETILKSEISEIIEKNTEIESEIIEKNNNNADDNQSNKEINDHQEQTENDEKLENDTNEEKKSKLAFLKKLNFLKIDESLTFQEKKQAKLKKIIILVSVLFGLVLLIGIVLYFTEAFKPDIIKKPKDINITIVKKNSIVKIKSKPIKKYINFKISQINIKRLNKKLSLLTKYEIIEDDIIEQQKAIEKERLYKEQQKKFILFSKQNKEEPLFKKVHNNKIDIIHKNQYTIEGIEKNQIKIDKNNITNSNIIIKKFIQISTLKITKFSKLIKESKKNKASLSICKDENGKKQIYIGPFISDKKRDFIIKKVNYKLRSTIKKLDLSDIDFKKRCRF
jgi:hypothetical protein